MLVGPPVGTIFLALLSTLGNFLGASSYDGTCTAGRICQTGSKRVALTHRATPSTLLAGDNAERQSLEQTGLYETRDRKHDLLGISFLRYSKLEIDCRVLPPEKSRRGSLFSLLSLLERCASYSSRIAALRYICFMSTIKFSRQKPSTQPTRDVLLTWEISGIYTGIPGLTVNLDGEPRGANGMHSPK